jgi:hypothetical protein
VEYAADAGLGAAAAGYDTFLDQVRELSDI